MVLVFILAQWSTALAGHHCHLGNLKIREAWGEDPRAVESGFLGWRGPTISTLIVPRKDAGVTVTDQGSLQNLFVGWRLGGFTVHGVA